MCLILIAWRVHPHTPLVVAANRDEFHARPAAPARWWSDAPEVLAGRDLQAGGTWLGVSGRGRFAAVTNYREGQPGSGPRSRGELVTGFLTGSLAPAEYAASLEPLRAEYAGFSLLLSDGESLVATSNRAEATTALAPGIYGLSNHLLETPWFKVRRGKAALAEAVASDDALQPDELLTLLDDRTPPPEEELGSGERGALPPALERRVGACFVVSERYGTRCSTVVLWGADREVTFVERQFDPRGAPLSTGRFGFSVGRPIA